LPALIAALLAAAGSGCVTGPGGDSPTTPPDMPPVEPPALEESNLPTIPAVGETQTQIAVATPPATPPAEPPKPAPNGPKPGERWVSPATGMEFVWVDSLKMWVGKYEVTNGEYRRMKPEHYSEVYLGANLNGNRQPVVYVNFYGARMFAEWMTDGDRASGHLSDELRYRLPSRTEWQAFVECGDDRQFPWGNEMPPRYGNYADAAAKLTFPKWPTIAGYDDGSPASCAVENSGMNDWGLFGVGGNVWEATASDPSGRFFGAWRGASWRHDNEYDLGCLRESVRDAASLESDFGFRLVLVPSAQ